MEAHMRILIVCKGNTCRSPMYAEMLKRHFAAHGRQHHIESAGTLKEAAGQTAAVHWRELEDETGVNLDPHRSRWIGDVDLTAFEWVICMDLETLEILKGLAPPSLEVELANDPYGIFNPWQKGVDAYRECYSQICEAVSQIPPQR